MTEVERVGIRELKAHLSACVERVKAGETLLVTNRGAAVAEIRPVGATRSWTISSRRALQPEAPSLGGCPSRSRSMALFWICWMKTDCDRHLLRHLSARAAGDR